MVIEWEDNHLPFFLYFPLKQGKMTLKLINNLDKNEYVFTVSDKETSRMFFHFTLNLKKNMADGEYTYVLTDEGEEVATGLLQIGNYAAPSTAYTKNNTYKQYKG